MIDTVDQQLRALERFKCGPGGFGDVLLAVDLIQKLDPLTIEAWEMERDPLKTPNINELFPFLEKRILGLRNNEATVQGRNTAKPLTFGSRNQGQP